MFVFLECVEEKREEGTDTAEKVAEAKPNKAQGGGGGGDGGPDGGVTDRAWLC